jgi:uncharacterized protein YdgA (DUF945 family)
MNKTAGIAAGVVVVVGVLATAGAWYTGTQLEAALKDSLQQGNQELAETFKGTNTSVTVEMVSLDRHVFTSTAHYRVDIQNLEDSTQSSEWLLVDHIEHGPLPWSRLKTLNLIPVMALSNAEIENNENTAKLFALSNGAVPIKAQTAIGYDRSAKGWMQLAPLEMSDADGAFKFSGMRMDFEGSDKAEKLAVTGNMDDLQMNVDSPDGPVSIGIKGLTFDTGGTKGQSGFYLGHSSLKLQDAAFQAAGRPAVRITGLTNTNLAQEEGGKFAAQVNYDVGMIAYAGKDIGSAHMGIKLGNFDVAATQSLYDLYQSKILPQQQAAAATGIQQPLQLEPADEQRMNADLAKLLAGKPHIELEKLSLKTANGESHMRVAIDLADPGSLDQPANVLATKALGQVEAKVVLSKPMIRDLATQQAIREGQTDLNQIAQQATAASDMASAMAEMMQLAKVDGDNIVSNLHYANDVVDFNGQKMPLQVFLANVLGKVGALGGQ